MKEKNDRHLQNSVALGLIADVRSDDPVRMQKSRRSHAGQFLVDVGGLLHGVEGSTGEIGQGGSGSCHQSHDAFHSTGKESTDSFTLGALNGPEDDARDAVDDAHEETFASLCQILAQVGGASQERLTPMFLVVFVEGQEGQAFAQCSGDLGCGSGHSAHRVTDQTASAQRQSFDEFAWSLNGTCSTSNHEFILNDSPAFFGVSGDVKHT